MERDKVISKGQSRLVPGWEVVFGGSRVVMNFMRKEVADSERWCREQE